MKEDILKIIDTFPPAEAVELIKSLLSLEDSDPLKEGKIVRILNVFENGSLKRDYSGIYIYNDGPNDIRQLTYSIGFTEFGNLPELIKNYSEANGKYSNDLKEYVGKIGTSPSLHSDTRLKNLLKAAGDDPVMRKEQDKLFAKKYLGPAKKFFNENGFILPLSLLVISDSYLHSGSVLWFLRKRFAEAPPVKGGDEKEWIKQYVNTRNNWLATHSRPILRKTVYRTNCFKEQMRNDNWGLSQLVKANGILVN